MRRNRLSLMPGLVLGAVAALGLGLGWMISNRGLGALGAVGLVMICGHAATARAKRPTPPPVEAEPPAAPPADSPQPRPAQPQDTAGFTGQLLAQGRYALLLRPQIARRLDEREFRQALGALSQGMALVPDGEVLLEAAHQALRDGAGPEEGVGPSGRVAHVDPFFLDRYPVTNEQYYQFVAAGAYQDASLWDPLILPALLTFVDQTAQPGPRFWLDGRFDQEKADNPVVGICWYEADAYARWVGKRLPTDAEWVKAAAWPVNLSGLGLAQRRFPWGDTMDRSKANLWTPGPNGTARLDQFADGVSVGGVYHLVGNVWEWTSGDFPPEHSAAEDWLLELPMKSIRGGAFDTYFDNQATCQFQSADAAIARKHNIGLRCAVSVRDLLLARPAHPPGAPLDEPGPAPAELPP